MPRYLKKDGKKVPDVKTTKSWINIPVKSNKPSIATDFETYLIPKRVADYIIKLESKIKGDLPKLAIKKDGKKNR